ncbi:MAG: GspE/PulE family protein [Candidatus Buchananbacteria bacterium]
MDQRIKAAQFAEAQKLVEQLNKSGLTTFVMQDRYLDLEHLVRAIEEGGGDQVVGVERDGLVPMTNRGLLPVLADDRGIRLIGLCSHKEDGQVQSAEILFDSISDYFNMAGLNLNNPPRNFIIIPPDLFHELIQRRLLFDQDSRREYLGVLEKAQPARTFVELVETAIDALATDIHLEIGDNLPLPECWQNSLGERLAVGNAARIRFRIQGELETTKHILPKAFYVRLVGAIKSMTNMKLEEHRLPQDSKICFNQDFFLRYSDLASFQAKLSNYELRVATLAPTGGGENITLRILESRGKIKRLDKLIRLPDVCARFRKLITQPQGLIVLAGPTGSGKTTTLYAAIGEVNEPTVKIMTIEDPPEINLPGVIQTEVKESIGYTFAVGLRSFLRHDPDYIFVGEVRDQETAEVAIQASNTGHLVFTTMHALDSIGVVNRLQGLGINPAILATALLATMSQRLIRTVCPKCSEPIPGNELIVELIGGQTPPVVKDAVIYVRKANPKGCAECLRGFRQRALLPELFVPSPNILDHIALKGASETDHLRQMAIQEGFKPMAWQAVMSILHGYTTIEEVITSAVNTDQIMRCGKMISETMTNQVGSIVEHQRKNFNIRY